MMPPVLTLTEILLVHVTWVIQAMEEIVQVCVEVQTMSLSSFNEKTTKNINI
jgi:hypothetical protein